MSITPADKATAVFRRVWPIVKWLLFGLVLLFIGDRARRLWQQGEFTSIEVNWLWLLASCGLYIVSWCPSVLFWQRLIHGFGGSCRTADVAQAYFAGHLGKYIPGKASVLIIRAGILQDRGCQAGLAALTSTCETLICMGVGAAVSLTLAPLAWPSRLVERLPMPIRVGMERPLLFGAAVVVASVVLVPLIARLLTLVACKLAPSTEPSELSDSTPVRANRLLPWHVLLAWCFAFVTTWLLQGLSLGCALRAVGVGAAWSDWLTWTGEISSASFLGFVAVFAPGGLGVREGILSELLADQSGISAAQGLMAAVLLRGTWLLGEIIATLGSGLSAVRGRRRTAGVVEQQASSNSGHRRTAGVGFDDGSASHIPSPH
jgi:hypothetical protein